MGGPQDGARLALQDGEQYVRMAKPEPMVWTSAKYPDEPVAMDTVVVPVERTWDGRFLLRWPKGF